MKHSKLILGSLVIASALMLMGCGKKGKGNAAVQSCVNGICTFTSGTTGAQLNIGPGYWQHNINVTNVDLYRTFLAQNNVCGQYNCNSMANFVGLYAELTQGMVPGQARFVITPVDGRGNSSRRRLGDFAVAYASAGTSFAVVYNPMNNMHSMNTMGRGFNPRFGGRFGGNLMMPPPSYYQYNGIAQNSTVPMLQISVGFTDTHKTRAFARLYYLGQEFASGNIDGQLVGYGFNNSGYGLDSGVGFRRSNFIDGGFDRGFQYMDSVGFDAFNYDDLLINKVNRQDRTSREADEAKEDGGLFL